MFNIHRMDWLLVVSGKFSRLQVKVVLITVIDEDWVCGGIRERLD